MPAGQCVRVSSLFTVCFFFFSDNIQWRAHANRSYFIISFNFHLFIVCDALVPSAALFAVAVADATMRLNGSKYPNAMGLNLNDEICK